LAGQTGLAEDQLLGIIRFVARTAHYRTVSKVVARRIPDDVWLDDDGCWNVSYELHPVGSAQEEVALFQLRSDSDRWSLLKAIQVQRAGDVVTVKDVRTAVK
jgi:hypothetical protein